MKKTTFRLLGLFLAMFAMTSQPVQAEDFINSLRDFFNEYYNGQQYGDRVRIIPKNMWVRNLYQR